MLAEHARVDVFGALSIRGTILQWRKQVHYFLIDLHHPGFAWFIELNRVSLPLAEHVR
jgi:hypothetical protein